MRIPDAADAATGNQQQIALTRVGHLLASAVLFVVSGAFANDVGSLCVSPGEHVAPTAWGNGP